MKQYLVNGELREWTGKTAEVHTPILLRSGQPNAPIGCFPMLTKEVSLEALDAAVKAYDSGRGAWPTSSVSFRIAAMERFLEGLQNKRGEIANILMWEICKTQPDAAKEVDRTIK